MKLALRIGALRGRMLVAVLKTLWGLLLVAFGAALLVQAVSLFEQDTRASRALARTLAASSARALAANDPAAADATLGALRSRPEVELAVLRFQSGEVLARYRRDPGRPLPSESLPPSELGAVLRAGQLEVCEEVALEGQRVGLLWLRSDLREVRLAIWRSAAWLASAWLGTSLLGLLLAWRLEHSWSRPVERLASALNRVSAADYEASVPEEGPAELAQLAGRFNAMLAGLRERIARIEVQRGSLADAVAERTRDLSRANRELERAVRELTESRDLAAAGSRAKSQFLANMSHEIRTPMNGVLGMTELLLRSPLSTPQRRLAETVRRSGEALLHIINDILDFSRIEAGHLELHPADFDLLETIEDTVESFGARAHAKGLELLCLLDGELPRLVRGDSARLRQVLTNLVGNAVKFTDRGEVTVRVRPLLVERRSVLVGIEVRDTGIGIPREAAGRVFDAFAQADGSTTRRYGGTGLGLAISKDIATLMGGNIDFDSEPGRGSSFRFTARFERSDLSKPGLSATPRPEPGLRVLVVDDNPTSRLALRQQCALLGAEAEAAGTAADALECLREAARRQGPFAVALVDLRMPGSDGAQLARAIRQEGELAGTRVVLMVTMDETAYWADAPEDGTTHMMKPLRPSKLAACLAASGSQAPAAPPPDLRAQPTTASQPTASRGRVLVAEDSAVNQDVAREWLGELGYEVDLVGNGAEALAAWEGRSYSAILMDCMMPGMDGYEATAELRRRERLDPRRGRTYVVAVTASAMADDRERCLAAGMDAYLCKPYKGGELAAVLGERPVSLPAPEPAPGATRVGTLSAAASAAGAEGQQTDRLDANVLASLRTLRGPEAGSLLARVVRIYLEDAPTQLEAGRAALESRDAPSLRRAVHTLRSSSANVGASCLSELCRQLEVDLTDGWRSDAHERLAQIDAEFTGVREALESLGRAEAAGGRL
jgi:two-component system, sensor histidine kinase and response regulator